MFKQPVLKEKVIILGVDAMDAGIVEKLAAEGRLPNLTYLKAGGSYSRLSTTTPPESAVAWSSFATGLNPGGHGIFDFIMRDPKTYLPYLSLNEISSVSGRVKVHNIRKGDAFWNILSKNKIPSYVYFCPNTFPADKLLGRMISGMGVPDITGTMGKFSFYTTKNLTDNDRGSRGQVFHIKVWADTALTQLYGPKVLSRGLQAESQVPLKIKLLPGKKEVCVEFQNNRFFLKEGNWSGWKKVVFRFGIFNRLHGILRLYLKSLKPDFELYVSPINFNPQNPPFSISCPAGFSRSLARKAGLYYTQGMPHDTWALTEGRIDEKAFLEITDEILRERENILIEELNKFKGGAFFFYFDTLDAVQHMFWRYIDREHPLYESDSLYRDTIFKYYERIDRIIGDILKKISSDTTLIVLSDHGFSSFRRSVHLNRWLMENGYLYLKEGVTESGEFFQEVDWSKTKAYALGFSGIYINKIGREYYGIVQEAEVDGIKETIIKGLRQLKDKNGLAVVKDVYRKEDVFGGPYMDNAPDLCVGFNSGFRASWQTALGGVPRPLMEDNKKRWSGDHLIDPGLVPGVIFSNRKIILREPHILDIAPTLCSFFGINKPAEMQGKSLFEDENK